MDPLIAHHLCRARIDVLLSEAESAAVQGQARWIYVLSNLHTPEEIHHAGQMGAQVNAVSPSGQGVLSKIINVYPLPMIQALLDIGMDPNQPIDQVSPLFSCLKSKSEMKMLMLIKAGADPRACKAGRSLLYHALFNSAFGFARKLYPFSPDFAGEHDDGRTLLHAFLEYRHFRACPDALWLAHRLLPVKHFDIPDAQGVSPQVLARELIAKMNSQHHASGLKALLSARLDNSPLPKEGEIEGAKFNVRQIKPLSVPTREGLMPAKSRKEIKRCLRSGWGIEGADERGRTILWHMAHHGKNHACQHLLEHAARVGVIDNISGAGVLHKVCTKNMPIVLQLVLSQEVDLEIRDRWGETPLFKAVKKGQSQMVKLLLEAGADAHARNCNGIGLLSTLMKCRVEKSVVNVLPLLLEAGLDPSPLRELIPATASRLDQVIARFAPQAVAIFQSDKIRQETPLVLPMARARF